MIKKNLLFYKISVAFIFTISFLALCSFPAEAAFRFITWSDAQDNGSYLPITSRQTATLNPGLAIFSGDFEPDGSTLTGLNTMTNAMNGISSGYPTSNGMFTKTFLVRGNHDTHVAGSESVWTGYMNNAAKAAALGIRNYTELNEDLTYSFDYDNARFIALDYPGYSTAQISWLDSRLADAQNNRPEINHVFIYTHRPFYCVDGHCSCTTANDMSTACITSGQVNLVTVLNKYSKVSAVFHGHEHVGTWSHIDTSRIPIPGGIRYGYESFITSPSGTSNYNSNLKTYRAEANSYLTGASSLRVFGSVDVNGFSFTVNIYQVGNTTPKWTRTFTKGSIGPTPTPGGPTPSLIPSQTPTRTPTPTPIRTPTPTGSPAPTTPPIGSFYVSPGGSGTTCSISVPCTLNTGLGKLSAGYTLYLRGGTYNQTVSISKSGTSSNPVVISGYPGETAIIDGGGSMGEYSVLFNITGNYVHVKDLEIIRGGMGLVLKGSYGIATRIHSHNHISNGILVNGTGQGNIIEDSIVHDTCEINKNGTGGHWASALSAARSPKNTIIRRNLVYDNWGEGLSAYGGASGTVANGSVFEDNIAYDNWSVNLYIQNSQNILIQRNLIYRSPGYMGSSGVQAGIVEDNEPPDSGYGNSANNVFINNLVMGTKRNFAHWSGSIGMENTVIANNTFVNASSSTGNIQINGANTNVQFRNNIIVQDSTAYPIATIGSGVTKSNNLWSRTPPASANGTNDIIADPLLSRQGGIGPGQLSANWFKLTSSSPAINKAVSLTQVINDYFKSARPYGALPDMGAHEFGGIVPPVTPTPSLAPSSTPRPSPTTGPITPTPTPSSTIARLIRTVNLYQLSPPAPDSSGITYLSETGRLLISDSEVEEMPIYAGKNLFEITTAGNLVKTATTTGFSNEPTGIAYNPANKHLYISDDNYQRIFDLNPGTDGQYGTSDDTVTYFSTSAFGCTDPEGVTYGQGYLYIISGVQRTVYKTTLNGSLSATLDLSGSIYGLQDSEGITYDPDSNTLYVIDGANKALIEITTSGTLLRKINISEANAVLPGDVTIAPSSSTVDDPAVKSLYIVARGVDNDVDPNENDGKMYEMSVAFTYPPTIPPSPGPTATSAPTSKPTPQPVPGDANGDKLVNEADYAVWKTNYYQSVPVGDFSRGDFSDPIVPADGKVNGLDYAIWFNHYTSSSPTNTPAPTSPPVPTTPPGTTFNFISWSDTETGLDTFAQLSNQAKSLQPEFTIYNGDAEGGTLDVWKTALEGNIGNGMFGKTFVVRGNGNVGLGTATWQNFFEFSSVASVIGAANYTALTPDMTYSFDYGNSRFIGVDVPGCVSITSTQNSWINDRLTDAENQRLTHAFIFFHQPVYYVNQHSCAIPTNLITTINNHPIVTATFHGHEHVKAIVQFGPGAPIPDRIPGVTNPWYEFVTAPAGGGRYSCTAGRSDYCEAYEGFANITVSGTSVAISYYQTNSTTPVKTFSFTK